MAAIPVTISNAKITDQSGKATEGNTVEGELSLTGLSIGGGPIIPDKPPTDPGNKPQFPIVLPPGTPPFEPGAPGGYPPMIGGGPIVPDVPPDTTKPPPLFVPVWLPGAGWIMIPAFPIPTPSKKK